MTVSQSNAAVERPLAGKVVLDLTTALAGPYATLLLGGLGATVIKIENPATGGDSSRNNAPYVGADGVRLAKSGDDDMSISFLGRARNKRSITVNLKDPRGRELFLELARHADVVVENYAAGTADRLGIGYEDVRAVNPDVVYTSISGFGAGGGPAKAMDSIVQALSGVMFTAGEPGSAPVRFGLPVGDLLAPLFAVIGTLAAVLQVERGGPGQQVDVSMLGALTSLLSIEPFDAYEQVGMATRTGNGVPRLAPFGIFRAADGWVSVSAPTDRFATGVFEAIGRPELAQDPRFATRDARVGNATELHRILEEWTSSRPRREAVERLTACGAPAAEVREPADAIQDPLVNQRGEVVELIHPTVGPTGVAGPGVPITFSATDVSLDRPAPRLGEDTERILRELTDLTDEEIAKLQTDGVV